MMIESIVVILSLFAIILFYTLAVVLNKCATLMEQIQILREELEDIWEEDREEKDEANWLEK